MIVLNKSTGLVTVGAIVAPFLLPEQIEALSDPARKRHEMRVAQAHPAVALNPGITEVDPSVWARIAHEKTGNRIVKTLMIQGVIEAKQASSIRDVRDTEEAVRLVLATGDIALLDRWRDEERRKPVVEALIKQRKTVADMIKLVKDDEQ